MLFVFKAFNYRSLGLIGERHGSLLKVHVVFQTVFNNVCDFASYQVCKEMMRIVNKLVHPHFHKSSKEAQQECWHGGKYFDIEAQKITNIEWDLKRLKLAERLKIVYLYVFNRTKFPKALVIVDAKTYNQDRWVYDKVTTFLPPEHYFFLSVLIPKLPYLPEDYWLLETKEHLL